MKTRYFQDIRSLLEYENYPELVKRIIDLSLDTENIYYYRKTLTLIEQLDEQQGNYAALRESLSTFLEELIVALSDKEAVQVQPLLKITGLMKAYSQSPFALGPVSLELKAGDIVGLVGENGNGKTTLLRTLCGELKPTGGNIEYLFSCTDGYDLRTKLVYIPQRTKSWQGSLLSSLEFTAASYGTYGEENQLLVQLVIARMGLRQYRKLKWSKLSSGYKMRFELARMLLRKPKLLLIDEPLANLDILAQQTVLGDFVNIAKSPFRPLGIVLSSQQLYEVEKTSDKVIFLKNGQQKDLTFGETTTTKSEEQKLIIEFESQYSQEELQEALGALPLEKLQLNGGTYIAVFAQDIKVENFLKAIVERQIPISYFRNISNSTRRFFL